MVLQQTLFCRPNDLQSDTENIWHGRNDQTWLVGIINGKPSILCEVYLAFSLFYGVFQEIRPEAPQKPREVLDFGV